MGFHIGPLGGPDNLSSNCPGAAGTRGIAFAVDVLSRPDYGEPLVASGDPDNRRRLSGPPALGNELQSSSRRCYAAQRCFQSFKKLTEDRRKTWFSGLCVGEG